MIQRLLDPYKNTIENALSESVESFGVRNRLRDAIEYALKNGGKRFRPAIVLAIVNAIGKKRDAVDAALAVEFFHTASLIADDLPCMDNDCLRRGKSSLHVAFDEATAILATFALIAAGYDRIRINAKKQNQDAIAMLAFECASVNTGIFGATGGQYFDLFPGELTQEIAKDVIDKKTGTLFEISFVFGWLFGGGNLNELEDVKKAARHFGMAFQISDDFIDLSQESGKINYPAIVGREKAFDELILELSSFKKAIKKLRLECTELLVLIEMVEERISQTSAISFS